MDYGRYLTLTSSVKYGIPSRAAAYRLLRDRKISAVKMGKRTLIDRESIDNYFATLPAAEIAPARPTKADK